MTARMTPFELMEKLVSFPTVSRDTNIPLIDWVADYLESHGIASHRYIHPDQPKHALFAHVGSWEEGAVVLSGHTDVVPALENSWISPAFELTERDGKLFGRGSADMKGFSACALAMIPELVKRDLAIPIHLCLSYDEEVGCIGVGSMVDHLAAMETPPRIAVIGEPTDMKVINGQKGKYSMRVTVTGTAGHSSFAPNHVNAIEYASRAINMIADKARDFEENGPFDDDFTVPHSTMLTTTIGGGTATNVTPDHCEFTFEIRHLPEHDAEAVIADIQQAIMETLDVEMKAKEPETGFAWEKIFSYPGMGDCTDAPGFELVSNIIPDISGKVSYGSEGGVFEKQGNIPSIICGPGSIKQAHKPNEFIEISQIEECLDFLEALTDQAVAA